MQLSLKDLPITTVGSENVLSTLIYCFLKLKQAINLSTIV
jgi:hypothetical protein